MSISFLLPEEPRKCQTFARILTRNTIEHFFPLQHCWPLPLLGFSCLTALYKVNLFDHNFLNSIHCRHLQIAMSLLGLYHPLKLNITSHVKCASHSHYLAYARLPMSPNRKNPFYSRFSRIFSISPFPQPG